MSSRIDQIFANLKKQQRAAIIPYISAGDPNFDVCADILAGLPSAGADIIELGVPFSDPMADGVEIQMANIRSLSQGHTMERFFELVVNFRRQNPTTALVAMTYCNPILAYGLDEFATSCLETGIDAVICVDLPFEEAPILRNKLKSLKLYLIQMLSSTASPERLRTLVSRAEGFAYYVAVNAPTGTRDADLDTLFTKVSEIRRYGSLPIVSGFGIRTPKQVQLLGSRVDGVVVGSAVIERIRSNLQSGANAVVNSVHDYIRELAQALN